MNLLRAIALSTVTLLAGLALAAPASALSPPYDGPIAVEPAGDLIMSADEFVLAAVEHEPTVLAVPDARVVPAFVAAADIGPAGVRPIPIAPGLEPPISLAPS